MTSGGSVCRGRTAPVPVVELKATLGLPLTVVPPIQRVERNVGSESARPVIGPVKESSARVSSDAGDGKERSGSCAGIGVASIQGQEEGQARQHAMQMVVE